MKPHGLKYKDEGCLCSLCRSRGYRKGDGYESFSEVEKSSERQRAKNNIKKDVDIEQEDML